MTYPSFVPGAPIPAPGTAGLLLSRVPGIVNVYVDGIGGLDTNDGLTTATALKTIPRIYDLFPWEYMGGARLAVNLAGVGGFGASATAVQTYEADGLHIGGGYPLKPTIYFVGPEMVPATLTTGSTAPTLDATPTTIVNQIDGADAAAYRTRFTFTTPGWTAADMRSKPAFLRVTRAGTKVLWELPIADNGTDRLWVDTVVPVGNVLATDTVEIVTPGVIIQGPSATSYYLSVFSPGGYFISAAPATFTRCGFNKLVLSGTGITLNRCSAGGFTFIGGSHYIIGVKCTNQTAFNLYNGSTVAGLSSPDTTGAPTYTTPRVDLACRGLIVDGSVLQPYYNIGCYGGNDAGISIFRNGTLYASTPPKTPTLTGSGNGTYGIHVRPHGTASVRGGTRLTLTGTLGDINLDSAVAIPYGTGVGGFEEVAGFNGNAHRFGGSTATVPLGKFGHIFVSTV